MRTCGGETEEKVILMIVGYMVAPRPQSGLGAFVWKITIFCKIPPENSDYIHIFPCIRLLKNVYKTIVQNIVKVTKFEKRKKIQ